MKKAAKKKTAASNDALLAELVELNRRQTDLLEIIAASTARLMLIEDHENRLSGAGHVLRDSIGLRAHATRLLTNDAVLRSLLTESGGNDP